MEENVIQIIGGVMINVDASVKKSCMWKRLCLECNCICENGEYLASIIDDSAIIRDEVIELFEETKTIPTNFNGKKAFWKTQNFNILFACLLVTLTLLIAVSIYCHLIKYWAKKTTFIAILHSQITNLKYKPKIKNIVKDIDLKSWT